MYRALPLLSKRILMPRLSPTHTAARIIRFEVSNGQEVISYDPVMIVECSPDLVTEAFRDNPDEKIKMMVDTQDEGIVNLNLTNWEGKFIPVGTQLGVIDDGDPIDGDWTWQANLHTEE
jgi:pyruvate/2-oxoglutarate dehydrogenase complex dihydrolipoamide acyltransferase (E2) component